MKFKRMVAAALAGALLFMAAGTALAQEVAPMDAPAPPSMDDPNVISMAGNAFTVPEMVVPVGTVVTWVNTDPEAHDVIADDLMSFESPVINPGETWQFAFVAPGTYGYLCDLHANMVATITVQDAEMAAAPAEG